MAPKKVKTVKKKEELPSFLQKLTPPSEEFIFSERTNKNGDFLGPVFFGGCQHYHPSLQILSLDTTPHVRKEYIFKENIDDLFYAPTEEKKRKVEVAKKFHPVLKHHKLFSDTYTHKCPGVKKLFVPEFKPRVVDLGQTTSIIEGEASVEIPLCYLKKLSPYSSVTDVEFISPSDLREENRIFMPYNERISHAHFPKQFTTVTVKGPTIPAALTITKLPSKRKRPSELSLVINSKESEGSNKTVKERENKTDEIEDKEEKEISLEFVDVLSAHEAEVEVESLEEDKQSDNTKMENDQGSVEKLVEKSVETVMEEAMAEEQQTGEEIIDTEVDEEMNENQEQEEDNLSQKTIEESKD